MKHWLWNRWLQIKTKGVKIQPNVVVAKHVQLEPHVRIQRGAIVGADRIGAYTYINSFVLLDKNVKSVGRFCSIAFNAKIGLGGHPMTWASTHAFAYEPRYGFHKGHSLFSGSKGDTYIGNDVWIGTNATILAGVTIGDGAIIGANALVREDVEPYAIVVGTPAKTIKKRFDDQTIQSLQKLQWWNWPSDKIKQNLELFQSEEGVQELLKKFAE